AGRAERPAGISLADLDDAGLAERMVASRAEVSGPFAPAISRSADGMPDSDLVPTPFFAGGQREARRRLERFVEHELRGYGDVRNRPAADRVSRLGPYLRFGQVSPVEVALAVLAAVQGAPRLEDDARAFL